MGKEGVREVERRQNETKAIQCDLHYVLRPLLPPPTPTVAGHFVIQVALHRQLKLLPPFPPFPSPAPFIYLLHSKVSPKSNKLYRFNKLVHPKWTQSPTLCPAQQLSRVQSTDRDSVRDSVRERGRERACSDCWARDRETTERSLLSRMNH